MKRKNFLTCEVKNERDAADEISSLTQSLEDEQNMRINLEENVSKLVYDHNNTLCSIIKEHDHALALVKVLKKEKVEFVGGHDRTQKDLEKLKEEHKALDSKFSNLFEAHEQLQTQLTCEHAKSSAVQIIDLSSTPNL